jgi:hypothetical protein
MATWRVQVKYIQGLSAKWSNVWHVNAPDIISAADGFLLNGVPQLLLLLHPSCSIDSLLTSDPASDAFVVTPVSQAGLAANTDSLLPLFNCIKVVIPVGGFGRPDLKYMKGYLTESVTEDQLIDSDVAGGITTILETMINDMLTGETPLCDADGTEYTVVTTQIPIQMRQMHRKRKKKVVV